MSHASRNILNTYEKPTYKAFETIHRPGGTGDHSFLHILFAWKSRTIYTLCRKRSGVFAVEWRAGRKARTQLSPGSDAPLTLREKGRRGRRMTEGWAERVGCFSLFRLPLNMAWNSYTSPGNTLKTSIPVFDTASDVKGLIFCHQRTSRHSHDIPRHTIKTLLPVLAMNAMFRLM